MASRMIHSAIISELLRSEKISSPERLRFGAVMPDAARYSGSHFRKKQENGDKILYDLSGFREMFGDKMLTDDLYLGYYLHLLQDAVFRKFILEDHRSYTVTPENVTKLHNDYSLLNVHIIERYDLKKDIIIPNGIEKEKITQMFPFKLNDFIESMEKDFEPYSEGGYHFFTREMADEFIERALSMCINETRALKNGESSVLPGLDEFSYVI